MLLLILALISIAAAQNSPPVAGTATLTIDLRGFPTDIQVSIDQIDVYRNQGGEIRTYTVRTTNIVRTHQIVITEGAAAQLVKTVQLSNGETVDLENFRSVLFIHLENYQVPAGNSYAVKLRININGIDNVFREYSDFEGAAYRVPLSTLGAAPSSVAYPVPVLALNGVTVWAGEYFQGRLAVSVVGHTGKGLVPDTQCAVQARCDSGLLVARASAKLTCADEDVDYQLPTTDTLELISNPSPTVSPVEVVRRWTNVAPATFVWWVLASDNYQVHAQIDQVTRVVALNCGIGECEAFPLTSVLSVYTSSLRGSIRLRNQITSSFLDFNGAYNIIDADVTRICVLNLPRYEVRAAIVTGGNVVQQPINCGDVDQVCKTFIYAIVTPDYSCLPTSGVELATQIRQGSVSVYESWGVAPSSIVVPALSNLEIFFYDGLSRWTPANSLSPIVTTNVFSQTSLTDCRATIDTTTRHQDGNAPGACTSDGRVDRMLSVFDLAFLPNIEAGYASDGSLPLNGPNNTVAVTLTNITGAPFRYIPNQGGAPRMYCVLPVELRGKIEENCACFNSEIVSCVDAAEEGSDCSICDFLSILEYDLTGLPRETNSIIYAGARDGKAVEIVNQNFNSYSVPTGQDCEFSLAIPNFENRYPATSSVEVWSQGCNGAPALLPNGTPSGNSIKVGTLPAYDGRPEPLPFVNSTCVKFTVPVGVSQVNIAFMAWQHGNGADDVNAFVQAQGMTSGTSLQSWIQVTPNAWTRNEVRLLNVRSGEQAELCFVQDGHLGTQIDNIVIDGQQFDLCRMRTMQWQGNYNNQIAVLRTGAGEGCPAGEFGRYCVRVIDGQAYKEQCVSCNDKTCEPFEPFACPLCLDLASPNDMPGLENAITVSINFGNGQVRTIPGQGGTNGCSQKRMLESSQLTKEFAELEHRKELARGLTSEVMSRLELSEVEKQRREILEEITAEAKKRHAEGLRSGPYTPPGEQQSLYPVLCLKFQVCLTESCLEPVCYDVDCTRFGSCRAENIISSATIPFDCPTTPDNLALTLYSPSAQFNQTTGQLIPGSGCQLRGPLGEMLLDQDTCTWSAPKFIGPSYSNVGGAAFSFPVLRTDYQVRLDENTLGFDATVSELQPDPLQHPFSTAQVDCSAPTECEVPTGALFSEWWIRSDRGLPQAPDARLGIRFGVNSQNLVRSIDADSLQAPDWNQICVLSDRRPWYTALWETWSSRGANLPFDDCSSDTTTLDECKTRVVVPARSK